MLNQDFKDFLKEEKSFSFTKPINVFESAVFYKLNMPIDKVVIWSFDYPIKFLKNTTLYYNLLKHNLNNEDMLELNEVEDLDDLNILSVKNENQEGTLYALYYFFTKLLKKKCEIILEPPIEQDCEKYNLNVKNVVIDKYRILNSLTQKSLLIMLGSIDYNNIYSDDITIHSDPYKFIKYKYLGPDYNYQQSEIRTSINKIAIDLSANPNLHNQDDSLMIINYSSLSRTVFIKELNILLKKLNVNAINLGYGLIKHNFIFKHEYTYDEIIKHFLKSESIRRSIIAYKYINDENKQSEQSVGLNTKKLKNLFAFKIPGLNMNSHFKLNHFTNVQFTFSQ